MHETEHDLMALQQLLDRSDRAAGTDLREIVTPDRRISADEVCRQLTGMRLLALATVTADNRPLVGPVDGIFYRGAFHFSSSPASVRVRHIRQRPAVSATYLPSAESTVTVHGRAAILDMRSTANEELRRTVLDVYTPRYGPEWEVFSDANVCMRIEPTRMFTFSLARRFHRPIGSLLARVSRGS
jgi:nitroimidazol reductase NimA-like FMN-containing flavoprotein (pyridoxamine 5'-phosphate oxidase superfamily)